MIELALLPQHLQVQPGSIGRASITLHTADASATDYRLAVQGLAESWFTLSVARLTIGAGVDAPAVLTLHPPATAVHGVHPFEVVATRIDDPKQSAHVEALLIVERAEPIDAAVQAPPPKGLVAAAVQRLPWPLASLLEQSWVMIAAMAAALLLFAGVTYALSTTHQPAKRAAITHRTTTTCLHATHQGASARACATPAGVVSQGAGSPPMPAPRPTRDVAVTSGIVPKPATGALPHAPLSAQGQPLVALVPGLPDVPQRSPAAEPAASSVGIAVASATPSITPLLTDTPIMTGTPTDTDTPLPSATATETASAAATETASAVASATASMAATATVAPTVAPTSTIEATATTIAIATATSSGTATVTPVDTLTATSTPQPTITPVPTVQPIATATTGPSATATVTATVAETATPVQVNVQYGYALSSDQFVLKWQSQNAVSVRLDDQPVPLNGQQGFPLQTHTFVLTATGADGSQSVHVVAFVAENNCSALVNGQQVAVSDAQCSGQQPDQSQVTASDTPTPVPQAAINSAPVTPATVLPATVTPQPTVPPVASPTTLSGQDVVATDTPVSDLPTFPTDTPSPTYTGR
ncbi:MAG TPA: hypothetical protein VHB98_08470 [Chloroflexota bacterium]|nr:hypothetical protein [Chloroflexota bacterium]